MFFHEEIKEWKSLGSEFPEQSSNDEFVGIKGWLLVFCLFLIVTPFLELLTANLDYNEILDFSEITEEQFEDYKSNILMVGMTPNFLTIMSTALGLRIG